MFIRSLLKKTIKLLVPVFITLILLALSTVSWLFINSPVGKLTEQYPHVTVLKNHSFEINLKRNRPKSWVNLDQVSKFGRWAIILKEDWAFYEHKGFDLNQTLISIYDHLNTGKRIRGASTISQQVIKNLFLTNKRSLWRKIKEAIYTYQLEKQFTKDRILELYLNIIELGIDVYGIKKGSNFYFKTLPENLSPKQAAYLSVLLPSPKRYSYSYRQNKLTDYIKFEIDRVLIKFRMANIYKEKDRLNALKECFEWDYECDSSLIEDRLTPRTKNPGPRLK